MVQVLEAILVSKYKKALFQKLLFNLSDYA